SAPRCGQARRRTWPSAASSSPANLRRVYAARSVPHGLQHAERRRREFDGRVRGERAGGEVVEGGDGLPARGVAGLGGGEGEGGRLGAFVEEEEERVVLERPATRVHAPDVVAAEEEAEGAEP